MRDDLFGRMLEAARVLLCDDDRHFKQSRALDGFGYARGDFGKIGYDAAKSLLHIYHGNMKELRTLSSIFIVAE